MDKLFHTGNRERLYAAMKPASILVMFSGEDIRKTNDEYWPFFTDRSFYYLTGLNSRDFVLLAVKDASGNISQVAQLIEMAGDYLDVYSGNDDQIVPIMSLGGKGVISVLSNVAPKVAHDIAALYLEGNVSESAKLQVEYLDLINDLFIDVNPIPVKEALNIMGYNIGKCRMPLYDMDDKSKAKLTESLKKHGLC
mgnify:CR=1 FL=1